MLPDTVKRASSLASIPVRISAPHLEHFSVLGCSMAGQSSAKKRANKTRAALVVDKEEMGLTYQLETWADVTPTETQRTTTLSGWEIVRDPRPTEKQLALLETFGMPESLTASMTQADADRAI